MEYKKRIPQDTRSSRCQEKENCIIRSYNQRSTYDGMMMLNKEKLIENAAENNNDVKKRVIADEGLMIIMRISDTFPIMALKLQSR